MLNLLDPEVESWQAQLQKRKARKAQLLRQGQLLTAAYEAGQLRELLEKLKASQQKQLEPIIEA